MKQRKLFARNLDAYTCEVELQTKPDKIKKYAAGLKAMLEKDPNLQFLIKHNVRDKMMEAIGFKFNSVPTKPFFRVEFGRLNSVNRRISPGHGWCESKEEAIENGIKDKLEDIDMAKETIADLKALLKTVLQVKKEKKVKGAR